MSVISRAKELIKDIGEEKAILYFEEKIKELTPTKNFEEICQVSAWETAIDFINGEINDKREL